MIGDILYRFFFRTDMPMWIYILRSGIVSLVPSLIVGALLVATGVMSEENAPELTGPGPFTLFISIVVIAPMVETFLMAAGIWGLRFFTRRPLRLAFYSAVIWAVLHSLAAPAWGLGVIWPFFVFNCAYLAWRPRAWWRAIWVTMCIHAFQNFFPALLLMLDSVYS